MKKIITLFAVATLIFSGGDAYAQKKDPKGKKKQETVKVDSTAAKKPAPGTIGAIITPKAKRTDGLLTVYSQDNKYFFLIPKTLLGRDMLIVNRISQAAAGLRSGFVGYAGDQINNEMIRFQESPDGKRVFVEGVMTREMPRETDGEMYEAVMRSNKQPIMQSFEIKATTPKKDSILIDVTDFINSDNSLVAFAPYYKDNLKLSMLQKESSYTVSVKTFPTNTEIKTVKTYMHAPVNPYTNRPMPPSPVTYEINSSLIMLPEVPMQPRYADSRVGYFAERYVDYDKNPQGVKNISMITRWRLEPKPEDVEKYMRGELVEPAKPIIYYIDPATPKKWVPYLMQGVNDWEPVFRKAGFKNAIMALEAPVDNPEWSLEDARFSAIVYKPSDIPNASGPHNRDPRSGEILESHINWYHNVMLLLRNWYMLQVGPNDPKAQQMEFPDELMGQLIRFVSSHEVGHTLGLRHNFGATSTVPVEKLRDREYLKKYGHTPSIMDYSRFNYVVQPEDGIEPELQYPRIQDYDIWAIEWGYTRFPELKTPQAEAEKLNKWIIEKQKDPRLWFGHEMNSNDPRSQSEDLGDNQMKANTLGIKNLQRVIAGLPKWTATANESYGNLYVMYNEVVTQYNRYVGHVSKWIGGIYENPVTIEQAPAIYSFAEKAKQKEAMAFLEKELYAAPQWLLNKEIFAKTGINGVDIMTRLYTTHMNNLLSNRTLTNLINAEANIGKQAYTQTDLYGDLNRIIFSAATPDVYKRTLQKVYINTLIARSGLESASAPAGAAAMMFPTDNSKNSDIQSYAAYQLRQLQARLAASQSADPIVAAHYQHLAQRISQLFKK